MLSPAKREKKSNRAQSGRRSVDASVPHYLNALRATLARCPIPLRALVGFAYLRITIYELRFQGIRALTRGGCKAGAWRNFRIRCVRGGRKAAGRRSVDASVPHYLNALRATLARCPIPLRALVGFAYLRFTISGNSRASGAGERSGSIGGRWSQCEAELSSAGKAHFSSFPTPVSSPSVSHLMENEVNLMVWFSHSKSNPTLPGFTVQRVE